MQSRCRAYRPRRSFVQSMKAAGVKDRRIGAKQVRKAVNTLPKPVTALLKRRGMGAADIAAIQAAVRNRRVVAPRSVFDAIAGKTTRSALAKAVRAFRDLAKSVTAQPSP